MTHRHVFKPLVEKATGVYRKREVPGNEVCVFGSVEVCACGVGRLIPADRRMQSVEVDIERRRE